MRASIYWYSFIKGLDSKWLLRILDSLCSLNAFYLLQHSAAAVISNCNINVATAFLRFWYCILLLHLVEIDRNYYLLKISGKVSPFIPPFISRKIKYYSWVMRMLAAILQIRQPGEI